MGIEGTRERKVEERICCEEGCDRPPAQGDVRCELHVLRMGGTLLPPRKSKPSAPAVIDAPVLDAIAPMKAVQVPEAPKRKAWPRLAGASLCQALGLASVGALLETFRFLDFHAFDDLPNLALFEVPYSSFLNLYLPIGAWILLTAGQLDLAWKGRRAAKGALGRRLGTALFVAGLLTAAAAVLIAGEPLLQTLVGKVAP
ncbi:MAG TPA: hypothetical protein VGK67_28285 [Myxococcales bacterium]|jgi:hypothetical protein